MSLGKTIKHQREKLNMTQTELAQKLNVGRSTIANWESDRNLPDPQMISSIAEVLNIPLTHLIDDTIYKKRKKKLFIVLSCIVSIILIVIFFNKIQFKDVDNPDVIRINPQTDKTIEINVDLPKYRTLAGYSSHLSEDETAIEITLQSRLDFSFINNEETTVVESKFSNICDGKEIHYLHFYANDKLIKTYTFNPPFTP